MADDPKIFVDDDWKKQAQQEKERLRDEVEGDSGDATELPPASFDMVVNLLATQAIASLGGMSDPQSGRVMVDPLGAKLFVDLLGVLEEKTKNNLTPEEAQNLKRTTADLRMSFVQLMQALQRQAATQGGGVPGPAATPARPADKPTGPRLILD